VGAFAVLELDLGEHLLVALGLEDRLGDQALIPERQVVRGHGQLAGGKHPAAALLGRHAQRARARGDSRRGVDLVSLVSSEFHTDFMPSGRKMCWSAVHERLAGDGFHDAAGDDEVGVRVLPLVPGSKSSGFLAQVSRSAARSRASAWESSRSPRASSPGSRRCARGSGGW
jgi:hypothetical protein